MVGVSASPLPAADHRGLRIGLTTAIGTVAALIAVAHLLFGGAIELGAVRISMRTLYTPVLILTLLVLARVAVTRRWRVHVKTVATPRFVVKASIAGAVVAAILMAPTLFAVIARLAEHEAGSEQIYWRSSAPGADLAAYLIPNPNHPLSPHGVRDWLEAGPGGFSERVASVCWITVVVILLAMRQTPIRLSRFWLAVAATFGLMSIGPFLQVAGVNTFIPGPWALLRYLPFIGAARMPGRMSIVVMMAICVLFAAALAALTARYRDKRPFLLAAVGVLLAIELLPAPRALYAATPSSVYDIIASDPRPIRVLELPTGVKDGKSGVGNFTAEAQFRQTYHGKGLVGGYLSRVPADVKEMYRDLPVMDVLLEASEGNPPSEERVERAMRDAPDFLRSSEIAYVVMRRDRTPPVARELAIQILGLKQIAAEGQVELYAPTAALPVR
jgi:hypothetical protein